jgi:hypothetical protein
MTEEMFSRQHSTLTNVVQVEVRVVQRPFLTGSSAADQSMFAIRNFAVTVASPFVPLSVIEDVLQTPAKKLSIQRKY